MSQVVIMVRKNLYDNTPRSDMYEGNRNVAPEVAELPNKSKANTRPKKDTNIILRCNSEQKKAFKDKAKQVGKGLSNWIIDNCKKAL